MGVHSPFESVAPVKFVTSFPTVMAKVIWAFASGENPLPSSTLALISILSG